MDEMEMKLPNGETITFNDEQFEGIQKIRKWLKSSNQFFILAGYSGVGKTTVIKKIIDEYRGKLVVSAPTHKAKKVISRTTRMESETLHSLLGLRPDLNLDEYNPNDPKFGSLAPPRISQYNLVIIDEASMINQELFDLIKKETAIWDKVKVLFMGDVAQIPPVGEKESVVFNNDVGELHQLTKVMRQKDGNPLFPIYDSLRNNLNSNYGGIERKTDFNSKGEGVVYLNDKREFRKKIIETFDTKEFRNNIEHAKVLAWRNETVMQSNKVIREKIFGKNARMLEVSDVLMAYRSVRSEKQFHNILDNSADYKVEHISNLYKNDYDLNGYQVKISEIEPNGKLKKKNVFIVDHTDHENLHNYGEIHDGLKMMAKQNKKLWKKYYEFRSKSLIMVNITTFRDGSTREYGDLIAKDMDYAFAITTHKCVSENTNVLTKKGDVKIKNIKRGDNVSVGGNRYKKVKQKYETGIKKVYEITTECGYKIKTTKDHKFLNIEGCFEPLKNFYNGDYIPIHRSNHVANIDNTEKDVYYYLGLLVADGSYSGARKRDKYRIDFTVGFDDVDNITFIENFYHNNNIYFNRRRKKNSNCYNYYISNKKWRNYLKDIGLDYVKGERKSTPHKILYGSHQIKSNFIAGLLDGDGSVSEKKGRIVLTNNSKFLVEEVQSMLLEFGVVSYIKRERKAYRLYVLKSSIYLFKKNISFRLERKRRILEKLETKGKSNMDIIPFKDKIVNKLKCFLKQRGVKGLGMSPPNFNVHFPHAAKNLNFNNIRNFLNLCEFNKKPYEENVLNIFLNNHFYDRIKTIKEIGYEQTYDLEIEDIHRYIANGFIVHNSQGSTYEHVFVLENDIYLNRKIKERNQILYVALSRPTTSATVLSNLI